MIHLVGYNTMLATACMGITITCEKNLREHYQKKNATSAIHTTMRHNGKKNLNCTFHTESIEFDQ